jgi:hypothetical protein
VNRDYLAKPELERLWVAARRAWERNGGLRGEARLDSLTEAEAFALDGLLTWLRRRPRAHAVLRVSLPRLDARLQESGLAPSLKATRRPRRAAARPARRAGRRRERMG